MYKINSFKELLNEIAWSWEFPTYDLVKHKDGYSLNKLFITKDEARYKTDTYWLAPGVYEDLERFYKFLKSTK